MLAEKKYSKSWIGWAAYVISAIPIIIYWLFWVFRRNYWFTTDPAAWYFLDSLAIFTGKTYVYVDHPGTPVHLIGSILLGLTYPLFGSQEAFIRYYIAEPEKFFFVANLFLIVANVLTVVIFYKTVTASLRQDKVLAGIALSWMYFAIHPSSFSSLTYWSHNSFNFIFGTLWLLWLYNELQTGKDLARKKIILLGMAVGVIVTTQLYLLPWLVGGVITIFVYTLRQGKQLRQAVLNSLVMLGSSLMGIAAMLAPIYREMPRLLTWLGQLITREGLYGTGTERIYSPGLIPASLGFWLQNIPLVMLALVITLVSFGWIARLTKARALGSISAGDFALVIGLLSQTLLLMLVLSKMFYRLRYTLALAAVLPVLFLLAWKLLEQIDWRGVGIKRAIYAGLIVSTLLFLSKEIESQRTKTFVESEATRIYPQVVARLAKVKGVPPEEIVTVYAIGTPLKCAALLLANNSIRAFDREIRAQCPNQYAVYDLSPDVESNINTPYRIASIEEIDWDLVVWPGNASNLPEYLETVGGQTIPKSWRIRRAKWFYVHSEVFQE